MEVSSAPTSGGPEPDPVDRQALRALMANQDGVISRRQAVECGLGDAAVRRLVRRREWVVVHRGVYVDHTGPLTWRQRAWAACLAAWPAALSHQSALRAADGPGRRDGDDDGPVHIAVASGRRALGLAGVRVHDLAAFPSRVQWNHSPPRVRIEEVVLDLAAGAVDDLAAIGVVADAVRSRRTTAPRLRRALDSRLRIRRRELLRAVLVDVADGTHSALEHAYLTRVERAHGLPTGDRQAIDRRAGTIYRDVDYPDYGLVVELDGRLGHRSAADRDRDLARDLVAKTGGRDTVRLGWGQATRHACATARHVGVLLRQRGWTGQVLRCPACPA